jgi:hypothetical protein
MSWQQSIGNQQDYQYLRDVLLKQKLKEHGGIKLEKEGKPADAKTFKCHWYEMNDGTTIRFQLGDYNQNGKLDGNDDVSLGVYKDGKIQEGYSTGSKLGDCYLQRDFKNGEALSPEEAIFVCSS